jgi:opacity protein-like surface antigen
MRFRLTLALIASLVAAKAAADDAGVELGRGVYVGVFGGGGFGSDNSVTQRGTAFFLEGQGGPLAVNAAGSSNSSGVGFIGGQVGHEWSNSSIVLPAIELEGFYLATGNRRASLQNPTDRLALHTFEDTYSMHNAVFLANLVFSVPTSYPGVMPYIGGGIGGARVSLDGAYSLQTATLEPGVNHFNTDPNSSDFTFAAQAKAGVRVALGTNAYVFGEYRYLYVGSTEQIFGHTVAPGHVPTTAWTLSLDGNNYQLATAGIGVNF